MCICVCGCVFLCLWLFVSVSVYFLIYNNHEYKDLNFFIAAFLFYGCEKASDNNLDINFILHSRQCNFIFADNIKQQVIKAGDVSGILRTNLKVNEKVKYSEHALALNTCNVNVSAIGEQYEKYFISEDYNPLSNCPYLALHLSSNKQADLPDKQIESLIRHYIKTRVGVGVNSDNITTDVRELDYRTTLIRNIKITCSVDLLGV